MNFENSFKAIISTNGFSWYFQDVYWWYLVLFGYHTWFYSYFSALILWMLDLSKILMLFSFLTSFRQANLENTNRYFQQFLKKLVNKSFDLRYFLVFVLFYFLHHFYWHLPNYKWICVHKSCSMIIRRFPLNSSILTTLFNFLNPASISNLWLYNSFNSSVVNFSLVKFVVRNSISPVFNLTLKIRIYKNLFFLLLFWEIFHHELHLIY